VRDEQRLLRDSNAQPAEIVGNWMDITERKELEQQFRQAQKMEAVGQLAGGVAHDFNNLLAVIRGNSELLLMDASKFNGETVDCLNQVVAASDRAANLTRQLLAFSRKQVLQSQPLDLNDIIGNLTKMLKRIIGEDIQLQCSYAARLPFVQADAGMIEQVLVNLVVNARDAISNGGQLLIATEKVCLNQSYAKMHPEARPGEFVCLSVADNGTGIAPEHLPRIFEPFFTTKEQGKGTGLGLATVYGIVKQHQGWIEVSSQAGAGTTFRILLPVVYAPISSEPPTSAAPPPRGGSEKILLVEDDDAVRALTRRMLESFGYQIREAPSGRDALDLWAENVGEIDLLLTDMVMPHGITGRELAERLRGKKPRLKVIFMSGYSGDTLSLDTQFIRRAKIRFLQKPCPWQRLVQAVRQCLDEPEDDAVISLAGGQ
jgi:nitrogen-specific signal transduction histidine kinase/CheY-like chemotaxis protein